MTENAEITSVTGIGIVSVPNPYRDGSGTVVSIFTADATYGSFINRITVKATSSTSNGMVRIFIESSSVKHLLMEFPVPSTCLTPSTPTFSALSMVGLSLAPSDVIYASTEMGDEFNVIVDGINWTYPQ